MRKGEVPYAVIVLILAMILLFLASAIYGKGFDWFGKRVDSLNSCEAGVLGTLQGVKGTCSKEACVTQEAKSGFYWFSAGEGEEGGCSEGQYCCYLLEESKNPFESRETVTCENVYFLSDKLTLIKKEEHAACEGITVNQRCRIAVESSATTGRKQEGVEKVDWICIPDEHVTSDNVAYNCQQKLYTEGESVPAC